MVVAAAGVDHEELVQLVKKNFVFPSPSSPSSSSLNLKTRLPASVYKGGELRLDYKQLIAEGQLPAPDPVPFKKDLNHIVMAWQGTSLTHEDMYSFAVLQNLLGGGGSFTSGGPGKGMYSRIYQKLLVGNRFVENANSFHTGYAETGLFGITAAVDQSESKHATIVMQEMIVKVRFSRLLWFCARS